MYASGNPKTKAELKRAVKANLGPLVFSPGPWPAPTDGRTCIEGPHYPRPHRWYAEVQIEGGRIVKVIS